MDGDWKGGATITEMSDSVRVGSVGYDLFTLILLGGLYPSVKKSKSSILFTPLIK